MNNDESKEERFIADLSATFCAAISQDGRKEGMVVVIFFEEISSTSQSNDAGDAALN